jgi:tRNA threonylcarbamoyl adenosine modification protein YeaZ
LIETSTTQCLLGIAQGPDSIQAFSAPLAKLQHERILAEIRALFSAHFPGDFRALRSIVVGLGPGSFVGCRLMISLAHGFSSALDIPVLGLSSFQIAAQGICHPKRNPTQSDITLMNDAKLGELYIGHYRWSSISGRAEACIPDFAHPIDEPLDSRRWPTTTPILTDHPELIASLGYTPLDVPYSLSLEAMAELAMSAPAALWRPAEEIQPLYLRAKSQWKPHQPTS